MTLSLKHPELAEALYQSLQVDAFYQTLERSIAGSSDDKHQGMLAYYDYSIREAEMHGILCVTDDVHSGASLWSKPLPDDIQSQVDYAKKEFIEMQLGSESRRVYEAIVSRMDLLTSPVVSGDEWYLSILGVHPSAQNKGLGKTLVEPILREADSLGITTFLETFTPRNMPFYERLGYQVTGTFDEPTTKTNYSVMSRTSANH